jgi:multimeric flavodoxin WrbA
MKVVAFNGSPHTDGNTFLLIRKMIVPGACYWNMGIGREAHPGLAWEFVLMNRTGGAPGGIA